ncbi:hypothetical protein OG936_39355 (plasmid) [Streptomyces sp. NBC_00846]|uniref:hypothetical protein n=1 Tax=Streptomyces sp. NBC_00846 TaxID=2975849 RepID=UPI003867D4D9|nr:hypothetical protein OG936_39355 [Streptomyces sp. NBC_00846]
MKYTVPPHKQERVAFTVGQKLVGDGSLPRVYIFKITLDLDDKSHIEVPEMTYMDSSFTEFRTLECRGCNEGGRQ